MSFTRRALRAPRLVRLVNCVGFVEGERRDLDIEMMIGAGDHLVSAAHHAGRRLERAPRRVLEGFAGTEDRLLADDAWPFEFLDVSGRVRDHPVAAEQLYG